MKMLQVIALCVFGTISTGIAQAAELNVHVQNPEGKPLAWAVVSLSPEANQGTGTWQPAPAIMMQQGILFSPFVLSAQLGTEVSFPNFDDVRHHVYSFSQPKKFELRLYGRDETKKVVFDKAGPVALGCNIHDNMLSYIYVTADPVHAVTDDEGRVTISGIPAGPWRVLVWHPDLKGDSTEPHKVNLDGETPATEKISVSLRAVRRRQYEPSGGYY